MIIKRSASYKKLQYYSSVFWLSFLLFGNLYFSSSEKIILLAMILLLNIVNIFFQQLQTHTPFSISTYIIWITFFNFILFLYGISTKYGGYSFPYHICVMTSCYLIYYWLLLYKSTYMKYIGDVAIITVVISGIYIIFNEYEMFMEKIAFILRGQSWYRLGDRTGVNSNLVSLYFSVLLFPILFNFFRDKSDLRGVRKLLICLMLVMQVLIILLTGSKKGLLLMFLAFLSMPYICAEKHRKLKMVLLGLMTSFGLMYLTFEVQLFYNLIGHRLVDMLYQLGLYSVSSGILVGTSTELRSGMVQTALKMFTEKPFFGWGWNAFTIESGYGLYSHNNYCELLVSMGLLGFLIYYTIHLKLLFRILRNIRTKRGQYNFILLISILFIDMASINMYGSILSYFLICMVFVDSVIRKKAMGDTFSE